MASPRIRYEHIDSTRKVTHDYTHAERQGMRVGEDLGRRALDHGFTNKRHIPLKRLPYNGLLFRYIQLESNRNLNENHRRYDLLRQILNATHFDVIRYDYNTGEYEICLSENRPNMKYYYTSPIASFGVAGFGNTYNVEICCRIIREVDVAYLKGGTHYPDNNETSIDTITQRGSKFAANADFDYLRIRPCDIVPRSCNKQGSNNDVCLMNHPEILDNQISGIYCMAAQDSLMLFRGHHDETTLANAIHGPPHLNGPGVTIKNTFDNIYNDVIIPEEHRIDPHNHITRVRYDKYLKYFNSIFLTIDADNRENNESHIGFSEVVLHALGHNSLATSQFLHRLNGIPDENGRPLYTVHNDANGDTRYSFSAANLGAIFNLYEPMHVVAITGMCYAGGNLRINYLPQQINLHDPNNPQRIRERNAQLFMNGMNNFNGQDPQYSIFHNMFISAIVFDENQPLTRKISVTPAHNQAQGVAPPLEDYTFILTDYNQIVDAYLNKFVTFHVNHIYRNGNRNGRLIYMSSAGYNHTGALAGRLVAELNRRNVAAGLRETYPRIHLNEGIFTIPGFRYILTDRNHPRIDSPLWKLRWFFIKFRGNLVFEPLVNQVNIANIINFIRHIPAGHITLINNAAGLAGGYRKKTRKSRINKKKTHKKRTKL